MAKILAINPINPQNRLIEQAVISLKKGNVIVYPTDTYYSLACCIGNKAAMDKIATIRQLKFKEFNFTLMCKDLSVISHFAKVDNQQFRFIKNALPEIYTFILEANKEVPKKLLENRKNIGLRVSNNIITRSLITLLEEPLLSTTLKLPNFEHYDLNSGFDINNAVGKQVDIIIDGGNCPLIPSTVIDLTTNPPIILRKGAGK